MQINEPTAYSDLTIGELTHSQVLRLCVYLMERDSNFNGNGFDIHRFTARNSDNEILVIANIIQIVFGTFRIDQIPLAS